MYVFAQLMSAADEPDAIFFEMLFFQRQLVS